MATLLAPRTAIRAPLTLSPGLIAGIVLLLAAFLIRLPHLADPAYQLDEEFYLAVGDRLLGGALPFVDIWDRKPIGLFLLFGAIRLLGGDGIIAYQAVATLFAAGTAWIIYRIARRPAGGFGGVVAGLAYLLWIETIEGGGGQSPIFYGLLVAAAAGCTLAAGDSSDQRRFQRLGFAAMALIGIAIQIKYTVLFEGIYFGLLLAWWRLTRWPGHIGALRDIAALAATALVPTLAVILFYAAIGQFDAFWFANFVSIFRRAPTDPALLHYRIGAIILHLVAPAACWLASLWQMRGDRDPAQRRWMWVVSGWMAASVIGLCSVGGFFFHYALPLYIPFCIGAAPIFRRRPLGLVLAGLLLWLPFKGSDYPDLSTAHDHRASIAELRALIPATVATQCMHLFGGPPILYFFTRSCTVSPYIFPDHLISPTETPAIGVDPQAEIRRIIAARPLVILTNDREPHSEPASVALLHALRGRFYQRRGRVMLDGWPIDVWIRR